MLNNAAIIIINIGKTAVLLTKIFKTKENSPSFALCSNKNMRFSLKWLEGGAYPHHASARLGATGILFSYDWGNIFVWGGEPLINVAAEIY